jgi:hypothetical protein
MITIPFSNEASFTEKIILDEKSFTLEFNWNDRSNSYSLTLYDSNNNILIAGRKVTLWTDLLFQFKDSDFPQGLLVVADLSTTNFNDIAQDDFLNERLELLYLDEGEI